jgi:hypothetical protein
MERTKPTSNDRRFERHRQRFPCRMESSEAVHRGFIADASASGLFVNTSATLEPGTRTVLTIEPPGDCEIVLDALVVRKKKSHRSASAVVPPGVGFAIETAPEAYYQLVMKFCEETSSSDDPTS